jgi:hypothetical protein
VKSAASPEIAIDRLRRHEVLDPIEALLTLGPNSRPSFAAEPTGELGQIGLDAGADMGAVSGAASLPGMTGLENDCRPTASRRLDRGVQTGIAGADDDNIGLGRQRLSMIDGGVEPFQPVGGGLEVGGEEVVGFRLAQTFRSALLRRITSAAAACC